MQLEESGQPSGSPKHSRRPHFVCPTKTHPFSGVLNTAYLYLNEVCLGDHQDGPATCPEGRCECTSFYFPAQRCLHGKADSSPAVAAAKGGETPSAGAAKTSPSTATRSGAGPDGQPRSSRNLRGHKAAAKCLPGSARQCSGRAASSRSPSSSSGGGSGGASWDPAARGPLTPGQRAAPPPARPSPHARIRPLRARTSGPSSLGPWGFASCRAMGTLHSSRPLPRSAPLRGAQPSAPRSSPGISGHGPGAGGRGCRAARLAGSCCRARSELRGAAASLAQGPGPHGAAAGAGRGSHGARRRGAPGAARVGRAPPGALTPGRAPAD